jgi:hypothetical protein
MRSYFRNLLLALAGSPNYRPQPSAPPPLKIRLELDTAAAKEELAALEERCRAARAAWDSFQTDATRHVRQNYALAAPRLMTAP